MLHDKHYGGLLKDESSIDLKELYICLFVLDEIFRNFLGGTVKGRIIFTIE